MNGKRSTKVSELSSADASASEGNAAQYAKAGPYSWYILTLLFFVYLSNHVDRQILIILLEPIKQEFGASDFQMGLLTGPAFALFYTIAGIPIARWADRGSRRTIIAISAAIWSGMTALSGAASSFAWLALFRVGVGLGEAGCTPPSHSLISDYFPTGQRARAMGVYSAGTQAGAALGWLLGGWLFLYQGWRVAFLAVGIPGLLLALLVAATLREPRRGRADSGARDVEPLPLAEALRSLAAQRSFAWALAGSALHGVSAYGLVVWVAPFFIRIHGLEIHVIGSWLGAISLVAGIPGIYLGGAICDRLTPRDLRWYLWVPILSAVFATPFALLFLFLPTSSGALAAYAIHTIISMLFVAPLYAMIQAVVRLRTRSLAVAVHLFVVNLFGLGLGPVVVGALNDALHADYGAGAIRYTMSIAVVANLLSCVFYLFSARSVRGDIAQRDAG